MYLMKAKQEGQLWDIFLIVFFASVVFDHCESSTTTADGLLLQENFLKSSCPSLCECNEDRKIVNCSNRSLRIIPHDIPDWVVYLSLRNNKITREAISSFNFTRLKHLKQLDVGDNKIVNFTADFTGIDSLNELILDHCSLESVPNLGTEDSNNVTHLYLSHNLISDLGKYFSKWPNLKFLDISCNRVKTVRNTWFMHQWNLEDLNLSQNRIAQFDEDAFRGLASIITLNLSSNRIKNLRHLTIPPSEAHLNNQQCGGNLINLKHLDLSQNSLTVVQPLSFSGMCRLLTLDLQHNRVTRLRAGAFYGPSGITTLKLDYNNITTISKDWLFEMDALENMTLSHNNLASMQPECWNYCVGLKHLDMSYNHIRLLHQKSFFHLHNLQQLNLSRNKINVIEDDAFVGLNNLVQLDLSMNEISSSIEDIRGAFRGLSSIKTLTLRNNRILSLSAKVMEGAESLTSLDLRQNDITSIQNLTFSAMTDLQTLYIESESFLCDCQLSWFPQWLKKRETIFANFSSTVSARCHHPANLKSRELLDITSSEFICGNQPKPVLLLVPSRTVAFRGENVTLECSASASVTEDGNLTPEEESTTALSRTNYDGTGLRSGISAGDVLTPDLQSTDAVSNVHMSITWKVNQRVIEESEKRIRIRNLQRVEAGHVFFTSVLLLSSVNNDDDGDYKCIITNTYGHVGSEPAQLSVYAYPKFVEKPPTSILVKNGSETVLSCAATGYPAPTIHWQKDGGSEFPAARSRRLLRDDTKASSTTTDSEFSPGDKDYSKDEISQTGFRPLIAADEDKPKQNDENSVSLVTENAPLHIKYVLPEDAGSYACIATSEAGRIISSTTVTILVPPSLEKEMSPLVKSVKGGDSVLQCMGTGYPEPEIEWRFRDEPLNHTTRHFLAAEGKLLVIVDTLMSDAGEYTCILRNNLGAKVGASTLKVFEDPADLEENDGFLAQLFRNHTTLGIILICVFVCVVVTLIIWVVILCYTRNDAKAYSTGTDDTELQPMEDENDSNESDGSGKGQAATSYQSLSEEDYRQRSIQYSRRPPQKVTSSRSESDLRCNGIRTNLPCSMTEPAHDDFAYCGSVPRHMHASIRIQQPQIRRHLSNGHFPAYQINVKDPSNYQMQASSQFAAKAADPSAYEQVTFLRPSPKLVYEVTSDERKHSASSSTATESGCDNTQRVRRKKKIKNNKNLKTIVGRSSANGDLLPHQNIYHQHHKSRRKPSTPNSIPPGGGEEQPRYNFNCTATKSEFYPLLSNNEITTRKNSSDISR